MDYDWKCTACGTTVKAGKVQCEDCGCPAVCSAEEAEGYRERYHQSDAYRKKSTYSCPKCAHHLYVAGSFRATTDGYTQFLDLATEKFTYMSCRKCGYTEFYRADIGTGELLVDFLLSN